MAFTTGTLSQGLALAGVMPIGELGAFSLLIPSGQGFDRLTRLGTVLQTVDFEEAGSYQVTRVFKLFGGGIVATADPAVEWFSLASELWVRVFVPTIQYQLFSE